MGPLPNGRTHSMAELLVRNHFVGGMILQVVFGAVVHDCHVPCEKNTNSASNGRRYTLQECIIDLD